MKGVFLSAWTLPCASLLLVSAAMADFQPLQPDAASANGEMTAERANNAAPTSGAVSRPFDGFHARPASTSELKAAGVRELGRFQQAAVEPSGRIMISGRTDNDDGHERSNQSQRDLFRSANITDEHGNAIELPNSAGQGGNQAGRTLAGMLAGGQGHLIYTLTPATQPGGQPSIVVNTMNSYAAPNGSADVKQSVPPARNQAPQQGNQAAPGLAVSDVANFVFNKQTPESPGLAFVTPQKNGKAVTVQAKFEDLSAPVQAALKSQSGQEQYRLPDRVVPMMPKISGNDSTVTFTVTRGAGGKLAVTLDAAEKGKNVGPAGVLASQSLSKGNAVAQLPAGENGVVILTLKRQDLTPAAQNQLQQLASDKNLPNQSSAAQAVLNAKPDALVSIVVNPSAAHETDRQSTSPRVVAAVPAVTPMAAQAKQGEAQRPEAAIKQAIAVPGLQLDPKAIQSIGNGQFRVQIRSSQTNGDFKKQMLDLSKEPMVKIKTESAFSQGDHEITLTVKVENKKPPTIETAKITSSDNSYFQLKNRDGQFHFF